MIEQIFDIECNGFSPTKIHCIGACSGDGQPVKATSNYSNMRKFFSRKDQVLIAHNGIRFDIPVVEKLLGIQVQCKVVDTLALSWYLYPELKRHGLEEWGEYFGVPKPEVVDWENEPVEVYLHRVKEDVKINTLLWEKMKRDLLLIYEDEASMWRLIDYLSFKMKCAQIQQELKWKLDTSLAREMLDKLNAAQQEAFQKLIEAMPRKPITAVRKRPAKPYKKSGDLSVAGEEWFRLLDSLGLPKDTEEVKVVTKYEEPKPSSHIQIKNWLYSLGWVPETFEFKRDKETNEVRQIPQVGIKNSGGDICRSIKKLYDKEPALEILEGLSIVTHRIGVFEGFLRDVDEDGYIKAEVGGLTNTLRFKHRTLVNLIGVDKPYGKEVRGCLICPDGYALCGSDMAALEDRTKQHYMWPYDPEYVKKMMVEGYCPHVDIAVLAGYLTPEHEARHMANSFIDEEDEHYIKARRKKAKPVNYGGVYGQKPKGLAQTTGMPLAQAGELFDIYWKRNWSVKRIAKDCKVKKIGSKMWLFNPVSKLWYSLRYDKDRFSTLNQGTGVYAFDSWVKQMIKRGVMPIGQFHDEIVSLVKIGEEAATEKALKDSVQAVNKVLKLNRELDISVQFGTKYSEIH